MQIKFFSTTSHLFTNVNFESNKPICIFSGASVFLHMMRGLLDGQDDGTPIDTAKEQTFVSRVGFGLEGVEYELCGVLCDDQTFFMAVNTESGFSKSATKECISKLRALSSDAKNLFCLENKYVNNDHCLGESDYIIANFKKFLEIVKEETEKGDSRPIYVFNLFERIDESVDVMPTLDELASLGRQVFVSVTANYPTEKLAHNSVQIFEQNI